MNYLWRGPDGTIYPLRRSNMNYLVTLTDGTIYPYERLDLLLIDCATNDKGSYTLIHKLVKGFPDKYVPTSYQQLRAEYDKQNTIQSSSTDSLLQIGCCD